MSNINLMVYEAIDFKKIGKKIKDDWTDDTEARRKARKAKLEKKAKSSYLKSALKGAGALGAAGALTSYGGSGQIAMRGAKGAGVGALAGLGVNALRRWNAKRRLGVM